MNTLIAALMLGASSPVNMANPFIATDPTVNVSAVRRIVCDDQAGSGFLIGNKILATASHVATAKNCRDDVTNTPLIMYKNDPDHDFALMTGAELPTDMPYIKYSCGRFRTNEPYISYGITSAKGAIGRYPRPLIRTNTIYATERYTGIGFEIEGEHRRPMRIMRQPIEFGMSGGPVTSLSGYAFAVNNAGNSDRTFLYELADTILCNPLGK